MAAASTSRSATKLTAALLLSRSPLLTPTPTALEASYHAYSSTVRHALSNPVPHDFYFKPGSLSSRRFLDSQFNRDSQMFGERLAGKKPDVGEIPAEAGVDRVKRDAGDQAEDKVGRRGEDEVYLVVQDKGGKWGFIQAELESGEALHQAATRALEKSLGENMDTWMVTRKPIGVAKENDAKTFYLKSHILAGSPAAQPSSNIKSWAWLAPSELKERLGASEWKRIQGMFGTNE